MKVSQNLKHALKRGSVIAVVVLMLASFGLSTSASAFVPYTTYTYDYDANVSESPHAYVAEERLTADDMELNKELSNPGDIVRGDDGNYYIADTANNRVVFLDSNLKFLGELTNFYNEGAIFPYVRGKLEEEDDEEKAEKALNSRLNLYKNDEEDPAEYTLTIQDVRDIEQRLAPHYGEGFTADREAAYEPIYAEYTAKGVSMPPFERMDAIIERVYPTYFAYDSVPQELIDAEEGETEEIRHILAYFNRYIISTSDDPTNDGFNSPEGLFVDQDGLLYVADTGNSRVIQLEHSGDTWDISGFVARNNYTKPDSTLLDESFEFKPSNLVVDTAGRLYINVKNVNSGIMQLSADGEFMGFYGAQKVSGSVLQWFTQLFQTAEQRAKTVRTVPRVYNNINIDSKNFVWVTANSIDQYDIISYISSGDSVKAPVKRLNPAGNDVLVRNGTWAPAGEVVQTTSDTVSSIVDVAVKGDTGIYTLADDANNKLYTYDGEGNLLYAFGGTGSQLGVFKLIGAVLYIPTDTGYDLLVMDRSTGTLTRFKQTEYAHLIEQAIEAEDNRKYDEAEECWKEVQKANANFDLAYVGLAKCYLHSAAQADEGEARELYQTAMEYYKLARNTDGYSKAFKEYRSLYVREHLLLVLAVAVVIFALVYVAVRALNKQNEKLHITGTATTLKEELCYGWRAIFHPINGFWEIKREKRGSLRAAVILMIAATLSYCFTATGTAYLFNNTNVEEISILQEAANVLLPLVLWVVASWCFTTLMSGEGSMKDIFIATCYALIPMILILIPTTLFSNICSLDEEPFLTFFSAVAYGWMILLVVFGSMVVQDYTFSKNLLTVVLSLLGMAAIMFIVLLLFSLTGKMFGFIETLYEEIVYRL